MAQKVELLAPAGSLQTLKSVVYAGADAVYFGGTKFSARAYADNLNKEEVLEAIDFGHIHGRKMILAINTLFKEKEMEELYEYLLPYYEQGLDAVIVQDFGVMQFIRKNFRGLSIHASTQMTTTGVEGAKLLEKMGASRIVLARELSLEEIHTIHQAVFAELECFVHGALCYCYSGQCLFSSILGGRSGNRGRCAQPCRLPYEIDNRKMYPLSPKDLCTIERLPELIKSGIYSFKIEGRMKQEEYAAGVVSIYRKYLDKYFEEGADKYLVTAEDTKKLFDFGNRNGFTEGYYKEWNGPQMITFSKSAHENHSEASPKKDLEHKVKIDGSLTVKKDVPMELTVSLGETNVTVTGEIPEAAQKQPITEEILRQKLNKTGNTPFAFQNLKVHLDEGMFLSMTAVNSIRRNALEQVTEKYLKSYRRCVPNADTNSRERRMRAQKQSFYLSASVETKEQIAPLLESPMIKVIYIDSSVFSREELKKELHMLHEEAKKSDKKLHYILPAIFRAHTSKFYKNIIKELDVDGFLVKSYDVLGFLFEQNIDPDKIRIDSNLYTWSNESRDAFFALGISHDTIPLELNKNELHHRTNTSSEMVIYGHLPLMISVQCIQKNIDGCTHSPTIRVLKDRYGISFPVKNHCNECYNCIYNSRPLQLFSVTEELLSLGIESFRFSFTIESKLQTKKILDTYKQHLPFDMEYTYGHYKRGVE